MGCRPCTLLAWKEQHMRARRFSIWPVILAGFLALVSLSASASAGYPTVVPAFPKPAAPKPIYVAPHVNPGDWPTYGHDVSRTSFNPDETTISPANVNDLVQRWQANLGGG